MKTATAELPSHPQPVNKLAALHIAGGDRVGRDELLWKQREQFERVMLDIRLATAKNEIDARRNLARAAKRLDTLPQGSFYRKDFKRHVDKKMRRQYGFKTFDNEIVQTMLIRLTHTNAETH